MMKKLLNTAKIVPTAPLNNEKSTNILPTENNMNMVYILEDFHVLHKNNR